MVLWLGHSLINSNEALEQTIRWDCLRLIVLIFYYNRLATETPRCRLLKSTFELLKIPQKVIERPWPLLIPYHACNRNMHTVHNTRAALLRKTSAIFKSLALSLDEQCFWCEQVFIMLSIIEVMPCSWELWNEKPTYYDVQTWVFSRLFQQGLIAQIQFSESVWATESH